MSVTDHTICSIVAISMEYALSLQAEGSKIVVTSLDCSSLSPPFYNLNERSQSNTAGS